MTDLPRASVIVSVKESKWLEELPEAVAVCIEAAREVIEVENVPQTGLEVSIVLASDGLVKNLNRDWRGKNTATDVLSFSNCGENYIQGLPMLLGDVIVALGVAVRDSGLQGVTLRDHLCHLIVHGVYHLLGYDHLDTKAAEIMEACETKVLNRLGIRDPYGDKILITSMDDFN